VGETCKNQNARAHSGRLGPTDSPHRESFFVELEDFGNDTGAAGTVLHATETTGCRVSNQCTMIKVAPAAGAPNWLCFEHGGNVEAMLIVGAPTC
jgi:hypothetical protein